ncbi:hypothetical protein KP509_31G058100 [Ceratopteris richardii]|uniref:BHLH domain-containing protein n=1 Tax=Ceratopteris richardii TaxID=49495 RepID=A0A8T2QYN3_CERRI|nr:hypothetical protein KP509_31G058100 [Ceratopteris richardii]
MDDVGYLQPMNDQSLDSHVSRADTRPHHQGVDPCKGHAGLNCCAFRGSLGLQQKEMHACGDLQQYDHYLGFDASLRETQIHGESIGDALLRMKQVAEYSHQIETPLLFNENAGSMASCEDTNDANGYIGHYRQSGEYGNGADFHCTSVSPDVFFSSLVGADEERVHSPSNVPHPFGETVRQSSSSFMEENCRSNLPLETSSAAVLEQLLNAESRSLYGLSGAQYASHSNRQGSQSYGGISQLQPRLGCASNDGHMIMHSVGSNDFRNLTLLGDPGLRSLRGSQCLSFSISTEKPLRRVADRKRRRDVHSTSIDNSVPAIKPSQSFNENEIRHLEDISTHNTNNLPVVVSAPLGTSSNLVSERKRRKKINEALYALRATVPIVSKMDKVSILKDAIDYTRQLQKHVEDMEDEIRCLQQKAPVGSNTGDVHAACREDLLSISAVRIEQEIDGYCQTLPKQKITEVSHIFSWWI